MLCILVIFLVPICHFIPKGKSNKRCKRMFFNTNFQYPRITLSVIIQIGRRKCSIFIIHSCLVVNIKPPRPNFSVASWLAWDPPTCFWHPFVTPNNATTGETPYFTPTVVVLWFNIYLTYALSRTTIKFWTQTQFKLLCEHYEIHICILWLITKYVKGMVMMHSLIKV